MNVFGSSDSRSLIASISRFALRTGIHSMQSTAESRLLRDDDSASFVTSRRLRNARDTTGRRFSMEDARSVVTSTQDSLETILDVLTEMQTIATDSTTITGRFGKGGKARKDEDELREQYKTDLEAFAAEIDSIAGDTEFSGEKVLGQDESAFRFLVDLGGGDSYAISIGSIGSENIGVGTNDLDISSDSSATDTLAAIDAAMTIVTRRIDDLDGVQSRLAYYEENPAATDYETGYSRIGDEGLARKQMDRLKLEIIREGGKAMLAQGSISHRNVLRLLDSNESEQRARIYSIDEAPNRQAELSEPVSQGLSALARFRFAHIQRLDSTAPDSFSGNNAG